MGYYVDLSSSDWEIRETPEALQAVREMPTKFHALKRGGGSNGERWFSWMNDTDIENTPTVEAVFQQLGFDTTTTNGGFTLDSYNSKTGQEDLFLAVLAPWTKEGSYIEWRGEDGAQWRFVIVNGKMYVEQAEVVYGNAERFKESVYLFEAGTMKGQHLEVDIEDAEALAEAIKVIEEHNAKNEAYYAQIRKEAQAV